MKATKAVMINKNMVGVEVMNIQDVVKAQAAGLEHALNWVKHWLNVQIELEHNRNSSVCKSAAKILKEVEKLLPKKRYVQLELFEF